MEEHFRNKTSHISMPLILENASLASLTNKNNPKFVQSQTFNNRVILTLNYYRIKASHKI
jgi:hypothetical protein